MKDKFDLHTKVAQPQFFFRNQKHRKIYEHSRVF